MLPNLERWVVQGVKLRQKRSHKNSGPPDRTASSHSSQQSSNDDASNFSSNESTRSKSNSKEEYCDEGVKLLQGKSMSHHKWAQKWKGIEKEVYNATLEASDLSKMNKILKQNMRS